MTSAEIRQSFLDFFAEKEHTVVPSASLLPTAPNLLFTNAGMNPFVPYFLGEREAPYAPPRAADTQKCIRAGGKHNDLDDVGFDGYHHTFFEMLGNWSFGDYFKPEAIAWAWELLTGRWGFPRERLYATIYQPAESDPAERDEEAFRLWKTIFEKAGLDPAKHILTGGKKDNFWMMGETGPCGPCSELHIDLTPDGSGRDLVNADSPWVIEIWNLVFIQYNAREDGSFSTLKAKHIDTGMGFERVAGILATTENFTKFDRPPSNYNADLFTDLFAHLEKLCGHTYTGQLPEERDHLSETELKDTAYRILADHARTLTCAVADGILPGNEGRNYVLRRILRRAVLWANRLELPKGSFSGLVPVVVAQLGTVFPEIREQQTVIEKVLRNEEAAFERTIDRGLQLFDKWTSGNDKTVSGEDAFMLYDTYGFPLDLTEIVAKERGLAVDTAGFEKEMEKQRTRARAAQKKEVISVDEGTSGESATAFVGYERENLAATEATVLDTVQTDESTFLVFDRTPFYAEMGGQVGDRGIAEINGTRIDILDTTKDAAGRFLHRVAPESLSTDFGGKNARLTVAPQRRAIEAHHSATHILHWALREVLGKHVHQAGSYVGPDRLRFDFAHFEAPTPEQLRTIEQMVNERILENGAVFWQEVPFDEKPEQAVAFFGDKYGDRVRVVDIGGTPGTLGSGYSVELCGGTHVQYTGEIGLLKIVGESAIAAGTRRVEAVAGHAAESILYRNFDQLQQLAARLSCKPDEIDERFSAMLEQRSELEKKLKSLRQQSAAGLADELAGRAKDIGGGLKLVSAAVEAGNPNDLRSLAVTIQKKTGPGVVVLGAAFGEKVTVVALCSEEAIAAGHKAGDIVRALTAELGGKGGGKPDFAMGGGKEPEKLPQVLENFLAQAAS